jgi:sarcosine oxidase gamma subunit
MSIIAHSTETADSVTAYLAFIAGHNPDPSSWTDSEVRAYAEFVEQVAEKVQHAGPGTWTVRDADGEHRFTSALAAAMWMETAA